MLDIHYCACCDIVPVSLDYEYCDFCVKDLVRQYDVECIQRGEDMYEDMKYSNNYGR